MNAILKQTTPLKTTRFGRFILKIPRRVLRISRWVNYIWALPFSIAIRFMRPFILIRFTTIVAHRIGHFVVDASYYLATLPSKNKRPREYHWFAYPLFSCNSQWSKMAHRKLFIRNWVNYLIKLNRLIPGGAAHHIPHLPGCRDINQLFQGEVQRLELLPDENVKAELWMRKRGWNPGDPIACVLMRDSVYLGASAEFAKLGYNKDLWSYHNYRNTNIDTFTPAIEDLLSRGYWVVRMGKIAEKRVAISHPRLIDYPFVDDQDDLLDIWLSIQSKVFLSTGTGIDMLPSVYGKHVSAFVNALPLKDIQWSNAMIWTPKHLVWKKSGEFLTLREHLQHPFGRSEDYASAGIEVVDLSPEEILQATAEQLDRMSATWVDSPEDVRRQDRALVIFKESPLFYKYNNLIHPHARIGAHYLRRMGDAFLE